jgi:hypothetical protein
VTNPTFSNYDYTIATMPIRNIIIFGDPAIDTRFVVELVRAFQQKMTFDPFRSVFKTNSYYSIISDQQYWLHHTAGLPSSRTGRSSLQPPDVLENLYALTRLFGTVHLLIYVVRADKPITSNFRLFYDYLCQQDTPIILVQTTHKPSELSWFNLVLTLDGADPASDKVNLQKAITRHSNRNPQFICYTDRFESAARGCWKLLEEEASWSFAHFGDALKVIFKKHEEKDGDTRCERIIEDFQMSLNKQSAKNKIQPRVDAIMSTVRAAGNAVPIPFLSVAAESVESIVETAQVCAIAIDSRSQLIAYNQTIEKNQEALENLANDAEGLVVLLWGTYHQSHDQKNWPPEELRDVLKSLVRYVSGFPLVVVSKQ